MRYFPLIRSVIVNLFVHSLNGVCANSPEQFGVAAGARVGPSFEVREKTAAKRLRVTENAR